MDFYKECFGGELVFQTVGETPMADRLPERMKNSILQATLSKKNFLLMGSDMVPDEGLIRGNSVSMSVHCGSETEIKILFQKLSEGGKADYPLENTFWGSVFGDLTDKYGNQWMLRYERGRI